jgi:uncharacterized protein (TIGR04222 family)
MVALWVVYALAALAGIATPIVLRARERRIDPAVVRDTLARLDPAPAEMGMLAGGPARMVDAIVVDLVERGAATAEDGVLSVPREDVAGVVLRDLAILGAVQAAGAGGITAVRDEAAQLSSVFQGTYHGRGFDGLVVRPLRRTWEPAGVALTTLGVIALVTYAMIVAADGHDDVAIAVAVAGWLPVTILAAVLTTRRRGYRGPDPRTALGVACTELALRELDVRASQASRVALGGFEAMTDRVLRIGVQSRAVSGAWPASRTQTARAVDRFALELVRPAETS